MRVLDRGATPLPDGGTRFAVWAPTTDRVEVALIRDGAAETHALTRQADGLHMGTVRRTPPGTDYAYRLDGGPDRPDPVSRWRPHGVHGPSRIVDPAAFQWSDDCVARDRRGRSDHLRAARGHVHVRGHLRRGHRAAAGAARPGRHRDRDHAGGRVSRRPQLGLRRRFALRGAEQLRRPERPQAAGGCGAPRRPRRAARRGVQPPRARGELPGRVRSLLLRPLPDGVGRGLQPRRPRQRRGAAVPRGQRGLLGDRVSPRRPPPRRGRPHHRPQSGPHRRGDRGRGARGRARRWDGPRW